MTPPFLHPPWIEPRTAYVHIPFCAHQCGYCDFAVSAGDESAIPLYLEALALELARLETPRVVETLFLGGGTPSHLNVEQLTRLFDSLDRWFNLPSDREFSFEANPDSLDPAKVELLADRGVTRLSLGVQSFQPELLTALERRHSQADIGRAVELAKRHGMSVSLDLIFAAPGCTPAMWEADLRQAIAHEPDHLSTYGLTYEKGTRLWKHRERGQVQPVPEADELRMYETAIDTLTAAGFEHYEVSNFAQPGQRCRHNERYWANHAYYGVGVGAAAYVQGTRTLNVRNTRDYIRKLFAGEPVAFQSERLNDSDRAVETMAVQLRRCEGIDRAEFQFQTGLPPDPLVAHRLPMLLAEGLIEDTGPAIRLTRKGRCVADGIIESLMAK
jgi:oxygen-independent coproporphyrinogen-3 oxidase